jgi:hypothetical protein
MNPTNTNVGGYTASELRAFLDGMNGDGTGDYTGTTTVTTAAFLNALKAQIGDYLYKISKAHSTKGGQNWFNYTVFLPSELEVYGVPVYGDEGVYMPALTSPVLPARAAWITPVQFPIFQKSYTYRIKRFNGGRQWYWAQTPVASSAATFCGVNNYGYAHNYSASIADGGVAPAFCVA